MCLLFKCKLYLSQEKWRKNYFATSIGSYENRRKVVAMHNPTLMFYLSANRRPPLRPFSSNRSAIGNKNNQIAENDLKCKYAAVFLSDGSEGP